MKTLAVAGRVAVEMLVGIKKKCRYGQYFEMHPCSQVEYNFHFVSYLSTITYAFEIFQIVFNLASHMYFDLRLLARPYSEKKYEHFVL